MVSEQYKKDPSFDLRSSFSVNLKVFVTVKARQLREICKCIYREYFMESVGVRYLRTSC